MLNLSSLGQGCQICKTTSSKTGKKQTNKQRNHRPSKPVLHSKLMSDSTYFG